MQIQQPNSEAKRQELKALDEALAERKRYYLEQEALITELVESGNTQLMGLTHDILVARQQLRDLKTDIRTAAQDKVLLCEDLDSIREQVRITVVAVQPQFYGSI